MPALRQTARRRRPHQRLARMSSAHDTPTSAIMQQLLIMQQRLDERFDEQQLEMQKLRDEMKQERNELRNELRNEMQQWRSVIQNQMTLLENEQSKIKAQVIATITNMEKRDEQLQIEFK